MIKGETKIGEIDIPFYHIFDQKIWSKIEVTDVLKA